MSLEHPIEHPTIYFGPCTTFPLLPTKHGRLSLTTPDALSPTFPLHLYSILSFISSVPLVLDPYILAPPPPTSYNPFTWPTQQQQVPRINIQFHTDHYSSNTTSPTTMYSQTTLAITNRSCCSAFVPYSTTPAARSPLRHTQACGTITEGGFHGGTSSSYDECS